MIIPLLIGAAVVAAFVAASKKSEPFDGRLGILPGKQWRLTMQLNKEPPPGGVPSSFLDILKQSIGNVATVNSFDTNGTYLYVTLTYQTTVNLPPVGTTINVGMGYTMTLVQTEQLN